MGVGGRNKLCAAFTQEVAQIPMLECTALRPTKDGQIDIISTCFFFLTQPTRQRRVLDLIREFSQGWPSMLYFYYCALLAIICCDFTMPMTPEGLVKGC